MIEYPGGYRIDYVLSKPWFPFGDGVDVYLWRVWHGDDDLLAIIQMPRLFPHAVPCDVFIESGYKAARDALIRHLIEKTEPTKGES